MADNELTEVRQVRHAISAEFGDDIRRVLAYYRRIREELKRTGEFHFEEMSRPRETERAESGLNKP